MPTRRAQWQRAVVALFVVVAYLVLAGYYESGQRQLRAVIERQDLDAWEQCHAREANVRETLDLRADLVAFEPDLGPVHGRHPLILPVCGDRP